MQFSGQSPITIFKKLDLPNPILADINFLSEMLITDHPELRMFEPVKLLHPYFLVHCVYFLYCVQQEGAGQVTLI